MAGLPHQPAGIEVDAWPPLEEALIGLRTEDLFIPTFSDRKYSNVGFGVLGNALGRAAGRPFTKGRRATGTSSPAARSES